MIIQILIAAGHVVLWGAAIVLFLLTFGCVGAFVDYLGEEDERKIGLTFIISVVMFALFALCVGAIYTLEFRGNHNPPAPQQLESQTKL